MKRLKEQFNHELNAVMPAKRWKSPVFKFLVVVLMSSALFGMGWLFGNGKISLNNYGDNTANGSLPRQLDYSSVDTIYNQLKNHFDGKLDDETLLDGIKAGLTNAANDPYTEYFNPKDAKEFYSELDGTFEGIGAELGKDASGNINIISPLTGYPAEKSGLKPKDIIAAIDDKDTRGMTISDAVKVIRGKAGTTVKLTIVRDGKATDFIITREAITIPSVTSKIQDGIGILTISRFGDDTTALARAAASEFKSQNVKGVVLDLRSDPGGLLDAAVNVSSLWLKTGQTVLTERRDDTIIETYSSVGPATLNSIPTVVLINAGSASAAEITAGALRDNNVATLIGVKSYGKGSVQKPINLKDGGLLKVTIARWYTPAGKNIDKAGIDPDKEVKVSDEDIKKGFDPQLDAALTQLK